MNAIAVRRWSEEEFLGSRSDWNRLLGESGADGLFMSWEWLATWWRVFGRAWRLDAQVLGAYDQTGKLVAVAPLYVQRTKLRGVIPLKRLQFMGNCWRAGDGIRSEYTDFVVQRGLEKQAAAAFLDFLCKSVAWDEFVICNIRTDSPCYESVEQFSSASKFVLRKLEHGYSESIALDGDFMSFLSSVSRRTREKLHKHRKQLEVHGNIDLIDANQKNLVSHFELLNAFHRRRWGKDVFAHKRLEFHRQIATIMLEKNCLDFDVLAVGGRPLSALYCFRANGTEYVYQMGYDPDLDKKLSPSFLHIGYSIERAYQSGLAVFDMLRGGGRNVAYKEHFAKPYRSLGTIQMVRHPLLRMFYRAYGTLRKESSADNRIA